MQFLFIMGIIVEASSGALAAGRKQMDFFGVIVIASITGLGGGTVRDVLLGNFPLLWVKQPIYILYTITAAALTIYAANFIGKRRQLFLMLDALGLATFSIVATERGLDLGLAPPIIVVFAMVTGIAGGMIRDILCNDMPLVLRKEFYAVISLFASVIFLSLHYLEIDFFITEMFTLLVAFGLRLAAIKWRLCLPSFNYTQED